MRLSVICSIEIACDVAGAEKGGGHVPQQPNNSMRMSTAMRLISKTGHTKGQSMGSFDAILCTASYTSSVRAFFN